MLRWTLCLCLLAVAAAPLAAQNAPIRAAQKAQDAATALPAPVSNPTLTIGPDVLTFPEIAQKLSAGGHRVTCAPALKNYAAFVYLKARAWDKACSLLAQGMQVQFRAPQNAPADRVMDWDSDTRRRERAWMTRFAGNVQLYMQSRIDANLGYLKQPPETLKQQVDSTHAEMERLQTENRFDTPRYRQLNTLSLDLADASDVNNGDIKKRLALALAQSNASSLTDVIDIIHTGHVFHIQPLSRVPDELFAPIQAKYYAPQKLHFDYIATGWKFTGETIGLSLEPRIKVLAIHNSGFDLPTSIQSYYTNSRQPLMQQIFEGVPEGEAHHFDALGKAAAQWLQNEQKQTQATLAHARLRDTLPFQPARASGEQSRLVEAWSKHYDAEAIMVLWPQREGEVLSILHDNDGPTTKVAPTSLFEQTGPWALHLNDGALCVQNLMAFLDRERVLPVAALVQYTRPLPPAEATTPAGADLQPKAHLSDAMLGYTRLLDYCTAAAEAPLPLWNYPCGVKTYRGMNLLDIDTSVGALFLWERLPVKERDKVLEQARKAWDIAYKEPILEETPVAKMSEEVHYSFVARAAMQSVPLSRFGARDLEKLTRIMRAWGLQYAYPYLPEFSEQLSASALTVSVMLQGAKRPYLVWLGLQGPNHADYLLWGSRASFEWQP